MRGCLLEETLAVDAGYRRHDLVGGPRTRIQVEKDGCESRND